jgi:hypothetical protein
VDNERNHDGKVEKLFSKAIKYESNLDESDEQKL